MDGQALVLALRTSSTVEPRVGFLVTRPVTQHAPGPRLLSLWEPLSGPASRLHGGGGPGLHGTPAAVSKDSVHQEAGPVSLQSALHLISCRLR